MQRHADNKLNVSANDETFYGNELPEKEHTNNNKTTDSPGELSHIRDVNSRDIFKNNVLTSQFLKDYSGISFFSDVKPEDIEDQTSRFRFLLGIEVEGDTIKKIQVRIGDRQEEVYVISLIEHKSQVDYDVAMQLLHYMSVIWKDYARKCNEQKRDSNKAKGFRYPLIIPIVYYEGAERWTAGLNLSDRISHAHLIMECIPDFSYKVIPLREYDNSELTEHNNEMSLIMMINKIQGAEDFHKFRLTALDYLKSIYGNTSTDIQELILNVIWGLLIKMDIPEEKATEILKNVKEGKDMGALFEKFQTFDWKGANEELARTKAELEQAETRAKQAEEKAQRLEKELQDLKNALISLEAQGR